jgi:gluconokinase
MSDVETPKIFESHPARNSRDTSPALIVVMGTSGCGKSTVGADLAARFHIDFVDGDSLHPQSNIDKMSNGIPLNDEVASVTDTHLPRLTVLHRTAIHGC